MKRKKSFENEGEAALYLVPTPIGNLSEISERVLKTLNEADVIAAEDTRNSGQLLKNLNIRKPLITHHEYNQEASIPGILQLLEQGKKVAVISDAGYPLISDPGARLVREVIEEDYPVISMSGPNAALNALVASGIDPSHYLFYGFLDAKSSRRKKQLEGLKQIPFTLVFYEAPHRIDDMLKDVLEVLGDRQICLARELTKLHEEYIRGFVSEVLEVCSDLKGEMVVVVEGYRPDEKDEQDQFEKAMQKMQELIEQGSKARKAAASAAEEFGLSKNDLYQAMLKKKNESGE